MAKRYFHCKIIGDGQSPETAYRPAIEDVLDPQTGAKAFATKFQMPPSDPTTGAPTLPFCLVVASGADFTLLAGNPDIDEMFQPSNGRIKLKAVRDVDRNAALARATARGFDTSSFSSETAVLDVIDGMGKQVHPEFNVNKFDVSDI